MRTYLQRLVKKRNSLFHKKWSYVDALVFVAIFAAIGGVRLIFSGYASTLVGDLNSDNVVNSADLTIFYSHWQQSGSGTVGDLNNDSVVNIFDFSILLSNYGKTATASPPVNTALPTITGTATEGQSLSVSAGSWSNTPTSYSYQWQDCNSSGASCANISGATTNHYTLAASDVSHTIKAVVTAANAVGNASATSAQTAVVASSGGGGTGSWWKPSSSAPISWNWVIGNTPSTPYAAVNVYDIDGFDNSAATVSAMHAQGMKVICYIDVGTYEPGRSDDNLIPAADQGSGVDGWPGEKWLNIADISGLTPVVQDRMNQCKTKGFDAIEPDNIDGYSNSTGFPLTAANQLAYNQFLATTAHNLGLSIGLKNDVDQTSQLQPYFDWALDEECNKYTECDSMAPFTSAGKAVFNAEYTDDGETTAKFCAADAAAHINGVLFNLNLDGSTFQPCTQTW